MELIVLGSSSSGNGYILHNKSEALIIEAGVSFKKVEKELGYEVGKISGLIASHEHGDHFGKIKEYLDAGIKCYSSAGTIKAKEINHHCMNPVKKAFKVGGFSVIPFSVEHDCAEPFGYYIKHKEMGSMVFLTDTHYSKFRFPDVNYWLIESNYIEERVKQRLENEDIPRFLYRRVRNSHMSVETAGRLLRSNDLSKTKKIVLIHISNDNGDPKKMKKYIEEKTGKIVETAHPGKKIQVGQNIF